MEKGTARRVVAPYKKYKLKNVEKNGGGRAATWGRPYTGRGQKKASERWL